MNNSYYINKIINKKHFSHPIKDYKSNSVLFPSDIDVMTVESKSKSSWAMKDLAAMGHIYTIDCE